MLRNIISCLGWLCCPSIEKDHFDLSPQKFCDGLTLYYMRQLLSLSHSCNHCSAPFTVTHALACRVGSLVICRHNKVHAWWIWWFGFLGLESSAKGAHCLGVYYWGWEYIDCWSLCSRCLAATVWGHIWYELWTRMWLHTVICHLILFCVQQSLRKRGNTWGLSWS